MSHLLYHALQAALVFSMAAACLGDVVRLTLLHLVPNPWLLLLLLLLPTADHSRHRW
jgi:hypothetical protein